jgi:hypothetical protein
MAARTPAPDLHDRAMVTSEALNLRLKSLSFCSRSLRYFDFSIAFSFSRYYFFKDVSDFGFLELLDCMVVRVLVPAEQVKGWAADTIR